MFLFDWFSGSGAKVTPRDVGNIPVVEVSGKLDSTGVVDAIFSRVGPETRGFVVDLSGVKKAEPIAIQYMDCKVKASIARGCNVAFVGLRLADTTAAMQLGQVATNYGDVAEAIRSLW